MKVTVIESPIGIFGFDENKKIAEKIFFPKDALKTAKKIKKIEEGQIIEEISPSSIFFSFLAVFNASLGKN